MADNNIEDRYRFQIKLREILAKTFVKGDTWYIIDKGWFEQCKKYIGFHLEGFSSDFAINEVHPGPIDNTASLVDFSDTEKLELKEIDLIGEDKFEVVPEEVWNMLVEKFTLKPGQKPIARKVIENTEYNDLEIELYPLELHLKEYSNPELIITKMFSIEDTVGTIEIQMRSEFNIDENVKTRLYTGDIILDQRDVTIGEIPEPRYLKEELIPDCGCLPDPYQSDDDDEELDHHLNDKCIIIQKMNEDGSWPGQSTLLQYGFRKSKRFNQSEAVTKYLPSNESSSITAEDVKTDLKQTNEVLVTTITTKIDELNQKRSQLDLFESTEKNNLLKRHRETIEDITQKKDEQIKKIMNEKNRDIEAEILKFNEEMKSIEVKKIATKMEIDHAVRELSKKLDKLIEVEENVELKKEMECPVCLDQMKPPFRIFQCSSCHLICEGCLSRMKDDKCPTCKAAKIIGRATKMEQLARIIYQSDQ